MVEGVGQLAQFVLAGQVDAPGVDAGGDEFGVRRQLLHRLADATGDPQRGDRGDGEGGEGDEQHDVFQLPGGGELGGQRALECDADRGLAEHL